MQYFSTGLALSLCGIRFRLRLELDEDPEDVDLHFTRNPAGCEACSYDHFPPRSA